jgi:hypothetical protein
VKSQLLSIFYYSLVSSISAKPIESLIADEQSLG